MFSWISIDSNDDAILLRRGETPYQKPRYLTTIHNGSKEDYNQFVEKVANLPGGEYVTITDCVEGFLKFTGEMATDFELSKKALDYMLNTATMEKDCSNIMDLGVEATKEMLRNL